MLYECVDIISDGEENTTPAKLFTYLISDTGRIISFVVFNFSDSQSCAQKRA